MGRRRRGGGHPGPLGVIKGASKAQDCKSSGSQLIRIIFIATQRLDARTDAATLRGVGLANLHYDEQRALRPAQNHLRPPQHSPLTFNALSAAAAAAHKRAAPQGGLVTACHCCVTASSLLYPCLSHSCAPLPAPLQQKAERQGADAMLLMRTFTFPVLVWRKCDAMQYVALRIP